MPCWCFFVWLKTFTENRSPEFPEGSLDCSRVREGIAPDCAGKRVLNGCQRPFNDVRTSIRSSAIPLV